LFSKEVQGRINTVPEYSSCMPRIPPKSVLVDDISLAYYEYGTGYPLILINGIASAMDTWNPPVLERLSRHYRVIIFDTRGTGYTGTSEKPYSLPLFARDIIILMDTLGIPRAHILGFSMGASIAQELVLANPQRVGRLILVAGTCGGKEAVKTNLEVWDRLLDKTGSVTDIANRMFSLLFPPGWLRNHDPFRYCPEVYEVIKTEEAARQVSAFTSWAGSFARLNRIRSQTFILTGSEDTVIAPHNSVIMNRQIPGSELMTFMGAGHGLMYQCPDRFSDTILEFLSWDGEEKFPPPGKVTDE
jgi:pimeloyl-ACP methyl ester carboxylesterase